MNEAYNGKRDGDRKFNPVLVAIISAVIGSSGGVALVFNTPAGQSIVRPDPFTGTEARFIERRVTALEQHVMFHPDITNKFDRRITILEVQNKQIIANQERILERLNGHTQ